MNTPLRRVGVAMMALVALLLANITYIQVIDASTYQDSTYNKRQIENEFAQQRGLILAADGSTLATSVATNDSLKYLRTYSNGPMYAPVTGYFSVSSGPHGMEFAENSVLNGSDDRLFVRRLSDLITGRNPAGGDVELTVDPKIQSAAYNYMVQHGFSGSAVAIQPSTGQVLAMVSVPSYDPNKLAGHDTTAAGQAYSSYSPTSPSSPLLNQATNAAYQPGSTFKMVVSTAALDNNVDDENTDNLPAQPAITLPGTSTLLHNFDSETCPGGSGGNVSMKDALAHSCNTAFATLAGRVGAANLSAQAAKFGFGRSDLAVPLGVTTSCLGPAANNNCLNIQNGAPGLYQSGIGQLDVQETPLQNAMIGATIANGGSEMQPQLVKKILAPDLSTIQDFSATTLNSSVMSSTTASTLTDMMEASEQNSGTTCKNSSITIASKTGTAEHGNDPKNVQPYGWYVAFVPGSNGNPSPIAVAVVVTSGGNFDLATVGAKVAGPVGRSMINTAMGDTAC
ncbi:MAG TPA: penicillin-binding transpeptidase domain-containing protein [Pseudonocardiaceae bacterium]|jgi:peptidoglycan glycosyltransferase|nr:penicillin-binding transpeptidase domain-containing protein [Pseudonocardiaceae bacterium]